ncbi:PEGA domain protein [compost metagenome]
MGTTPLQVDDLKAGDHVVRLELAGYSQWTAPVAVEAGGRQRVAASLELTGARD